MNALGTEVLGLAFLLVSTAATFLMFYQWGFPYDRPRKTPEPSSVLAQYRAAHPGLSLPDNLSLYDVGDDPAALDLPGRIARPHGGPSGLGHLHRRQSDNQNQHRALVQIPRKIAGPHAGDRAF